MSSNLVPRLQVLAAALLFSTGGVGIKSCALTDWQVASFRCGVAFVVFALAMPAARRGLSWRALAVGCAYASTLVCYSVANKSTTSANAIFLQSAAPLYILLLAPWLLGERVRVRELALMAAMAVGLGLCFAGQGVATATAPDPGRGDLFGTVAGFSWALTVLGLRWLATSTAAGASGAASPAASAVLLGNGLAFVACLPMALPVAAARPVDWLWILYLGAIQIALAYLLLTAGMSRVPAFEASVLLLAEPMLNPLWTWWFLGEVPAPVTIAGGLLILVATTVKTWLDFRRG